MGRVVGAKRVAAGFVAAGGAKAAADAFEANLAQPRWRPAERRMSIDARSERSAMPQADPAAAPAEASIEWIRDFEQRFQDAWNSHQSDRVLVLMNEDIEYRDDAWPKTTRGHADVRKFLDAVWKAFPDLYAVPPGRPAGGRRSRHETRHVPQCNVSRCRRS
jgi:hypothetical protein